MEVRTGTLVVDVQPRRVSLRHGADEAESLRTHTVIWAAGVRASRLGQVLAERAGVTLDRSGRVEVSPALTLPGHDDVFVLGDLAAVDAGQGRPLPGLAAVAIQQGAYVAAAIRARLQGHPLPPFVYRDRGSMAVVGRGFAVADLGFVQLWGRPGWIAWAALHLARIVGFENRLLVFLQWAWAYATSRRAARLITGRTS